MGPGQTHFLYQMSSSWARFRQITFIDFRSVSLFRNFIRFSNLVGWYRCNRRCDLPYRNIRRDYDQGKYTDVFNVTKDQIPRRENGDFRWRIRWDIWRLLVLPQSTKQGRTPSWNLPQGNIAFINHQNRALFSHSGYFIILIYINADKSTSPIRLFESK